jgi:hypothetical protein
MHNFFLIAYLAVLIAFSLLAIRMWYVGRGATDPAEKRVFVRFVLGLALFWLVAIAGYLGGFFSFSG